MIDSIIRKCDKCNKEDSIDTITGLCYSCINEIKEMNYFKRNDIPLSFRVSLKTHDKYIGLDSMRKKEINYLFNQWLKKQLNKKEVEE